MAHFDVLIIGAGQSGSPLAVALGRDGRTVGIVERAHVGGSCINYGCTPTKTMVASARAAHVARQAARLGVHVADVRVDLSAVVDRKNEIVHAWRRGSESRLEDGENVTLIRGHARFVGAHEVDVGGTRHKADTVVINVGARPLVPPTPGLETVPFLTSTSIMEVRKVPDHLVVLGGGYIGCEFGQMFRRFGAAVSIVNRGEHLLDREDLDVSASLEEVFRGEGIDLRLGVTVEEVRKNGPSIEGRLSDGSSVQGSHLLVAVGRAPNTGDLGVGAAGIELDARGFIRVDDRYRTTAEGVYAVGDVTGGPQFTHWSWDDHRILLDILRGGERSSAGRLLPYAVFTDPQVGRVGLSERDAQRRGLRLDVAKIPFANIPRALELDEPAGVIKVLYDSSSDRIVGAAIVGLEAGELIQIFSTHMQADVSPSAIVDVQAIHPTLVEGVQSAVMSLERYRLK